MVKKSILALALITSLSGPFTSVAFAGNHEHHTFNNFHTFNNERFDNKWTKSDDGGYQDGGRCDTVPEMDAGFAALGIGLTLGLVAFVRDRKRS